MAGVCDGECMTLTRCYSCGLPQPYEVSGWKFVCGKAYNFKGIKGKISFLFFPKLCSSFTVVHYHGKIRGDTTLVAGGNV